MIEVKKEGILLEKTVLGFENEGVLNPATIREGDWVHLFYRAVSKGNYSTLGYCRLQSPTKVEIRHKKPLLAPKEKYELQGMEDARIVRIDKTYFLTYTAYDGQNALGALATSKDLITFSRKGIITPKLTYREYQFCIECCDGLSDKYLRFVKMLYERGGAEIGSELYIWDKDVVMFPKKINGKFAFLHRLYPDIQIVYFNKPEELNYQYWKEYLLNIKSHIVLEGKMPFEASYVGGGCPPVETPDGWLMIYHGVQDTPQGYVYSACAALLDLEDPRKEIARLPYPLFKPDHEWELKGEVNNVCFPTGSVLFEDTLYIYYGAADDRIACASVSLSALVAELLLNTGKNEK